MIKMTLPTPWGEGGERKRVLLPGDEHVIPGAGPVVADGPHPSGPSSATPLASAGAQPPRANSPNFLMATSPTRLVTLCYREIGWPWPGSWPGIWSALCVVSIPGHKCGAPGRPAPAGLLGMGVWLTKENA
jgi:hypothetical protein